MSLKFKVKDIQAKNNEHLEKFLDTCVEEGYHVCQLFLLSTSGEMALYRVIMQEVK